MNDDIKVGDRVRVTNAQGDIGPVAGYFYAHRQDKLGRVARLLSGEYVVVDFDDGKRDTGHIARITKLPSETTTFNGQEYHVTAGEDGTLTLTPTKPKQPDLKMGQIWKAQGSYYIFTNSPEKAFYGLNGGALRAATNRPWGYCGQDAWEYVADSLKEALTSGLLTPR